MELFDDNETADKAQSDGLVSLMTMLLIWNQFLGKFVSNMMDNISTDPNYYTDETYSDMMGLVNAGEEFDKRMGGAMLRFSNFTFNEYLATKRVNKDDFYEILFMISETKSYIFEMDHYADRIGFSKKLPIDMKVGKAVEEMLKALTK